MWCLPMSGLCMCHNQEGANMCVLQGMKAHLHCGWRVHTPNAYTQWIEEYESGRWTGMTLTTAGTHKHEDSNQRWRTVTTVATEGPTMWRCWVTFLWTTGGWRQCGHMNRTAARTSKADWRCSRVSYSSGKKRRLSGRVSSRLWAWTWTVKGEWVDQKEQTGDRYRTGNRSQRHEKVEYRQETRKQTWRTRVQTWRSEISGCKLTSNPQNHIWTLVN